MYIVVQVPVRMMLVQMGWNDYSTAVASAARTDGLE